MAAVAKDGLLSWSGSRDEEGYSFLKAVHLVEALPTEGPYAVMHASGLPVPGSAWNFDSDSAPWVFCYPTMDISIHQEKKGDPNEWWEVEQTFSNKPLRRCQDTEIEDPMDEPDRISGSFIKYTREATLDRFDKPILSSSREQIRGQPVERDDNRPTVIIEKNLLTLPLSTFAPMVDTLNDATLWGLAARKWKLSNVSWSRQLYGVCNFYYIVTYELEANYNSFDRLILDEGTKVLAPGGNADNPKHFQKYLDPTTKQPTRVILDGTGHAIEDIDEAGTVEVEFYGESNLMLLGLPASL